jgi:hypothetical protein
MIDLVTSKCHKCGKLFQTWLSRGEIAPALCLGCWWKETPATGAEQSPAEQQSPATDESLVDLAKKTKEVVNVTKSH